MTPNLRNGLFSACFRSFLIVNYLPDLWVSNVQLQPFFILSFRDIAALATLTRSFLFQGKEAFFHATRLT
jgi:hypothetical protein